MKILVVQDHLRSGGTERQSVLMSRCFRAAGHDAELLTFRPGGALAHTVGDIPFRVLQPFDCRLDWFAPGLLRTVKRAAPDIVLCMGRMANCWAGSIQKSLSRRSEFGAVVCTMRTGKPLPWMFRRSLRLAKHVVANSMEAQDSLVASYAVPRKKTSVIRNALVFPPPVESGPGKISDRDQTVRARLGANGSTCVLLWVGMFRPEKNQRAVIEIAAQLPAEIDWQLWFAGDGPERVHCEELARTLKVAHRIKFLGFLQDPTDLYAAADVAVLTSRSESLSNFLIEAHAHGVPSVAYAVTGVPECGGRVAPPGNAEEFLNELLPLARDLRLRREEGERVARYAREHFSPAKQAAAYLELFRHLAQAPAYEK
jgi:glycosyltransferase involved in cell wall biosynthesis